MFERCNISEYYEDVLLSRLINMFIEVHKRMILLLFGSVCIDSYFVCDSYKDV